MYKSIKAQNTDFIGRFFIATARSVFYASVSVVLCAVHLLLPIERGFPTIRIFGLPFTVTILATVAVFFLLLVESRGTILWKVPKRYLPVQIVFVWLMVASALFSPTIRSAFFVVLSYSTVFILSFLVVRYLFQRNFRTAFVYILSMTAGLAALIGLVEGLAGTPLSFYTSIYLSYAPDGMAYGLTRSDYRVFGTLGNPIVYAAAMILAIPFALELRPFLLRYAIVIMLLGAATLAVSTTAFLMASVVLIGYLVISRVRWTTVLFLLVILGVFVWLLIPILTQRFGEGAVMRIVSGDPQNVLAREDMLNLAWTDFTTDQTIASVLFGKGVKSTTVDEYASALNRTVGTIDNTYATLLIETGVVGLIAYLAMAFSILYPLRRFAFLSMHWYGVLSLFAAGVAFTTVYYSTFNFVWVASVATLVYLETRRTPSSFIT
ncbi:hypothetical protein KC953_00855 [Candidatus Saccharibacteria bacterium]|nr:hypothetical protein [Candidatus Saccharibacteria bacterium]